MGRAWNRHGSGMHTKVWEDHLENLGIDGMPLLKLIIGNKAGGVNTIHMAQSRDQSSQTTLPSRALQCN